MAASAAQRLVDTSMERSFVAALLADPSLLSLLPDDLGVDSLGDFHARSVFAALANLRSASAPITREDVRAEVAREAGHLDIAWFDTLASLRVVDVPVLGWASSIVRLAKHRSEAIAAHESSDVDDFAVRDAEPPKPPWRRAPELVEAILERANDPWIDLTLGGVSLVRLRAGATAVLIGGSGSGKSSLTACMLLEHALNVGPAIALSIELPCDEFGARIVGIKCDAGWEQALRGQVERRFMEQALDLPRLYVLDRRRATLRNLELAIDDARKRYPGEPIIVAIDYAQLLDSKEREARMRVADAFAQIDDVAREKRVVALALSQMSRASASRARNGDALGAESADLGAESAAIERFATVTLSIGLAVERENGTSTVELSIGKWRMGKGDRVIPMDVDGRTGRWRVGGDAQTAAEVRDKRDVEKTAKAEKAVELQILGFAVKADKPFSRNDLDNALNCKRLNLQKAVVALLASGQLVEIARRATRSRAWLLWTEEKARAAGAPLVRDALQEDL